MTDHNDQNQHSHHHHSQSTQRVDGSVACPVMPEIFVVPETAEADGLARDYEGTRYYLCCETCASLWDADPVSYATHQSTGSI